MGRSVDGQGLMSTKFDSTYEVAILSACVRDMGYYMRASTTIKARGMANKETDWLWGALTAHVRDTTEMPAKKEIMRKVRAAFARDNAKRALHADVVEAVYDIAPVNPETALGELRQYVDFHSFQTGVSDSVKLLEAGDLDGAYQKVSEVYMGRSVGRDGDDVAWLIEEFEQRQIERKRRRDNPELFKVVPTKIRALDKVITGLAAGEVGLIAATTNMGKSILANHMGLMAALQGFYVLHIVTEMATHQVATRYDSRLTKTPYNKFKNYDFTSSEIKEIKVIIGRNQKRLEKRLQIARVGATGGTVLDVHRIVRERSAMGIKTEMIVIDSPDHFGSSRRYSEKRHEITEVSLGVKDLAEQIDAPIWGTTQAKQSVEGKLATSSSVADDYNKARIVDLILTINQNEEQEIAGEVDLYLAKYRDGQKHIHIPMSAAFETMMYREIKSDVRGADHAG